MFQAQNWVKINILNINLVGIKHKHENWSKDQRAIIKKQKIQYSQAIFLYKEKFAIRKYAKSCNITRKHIIFIIWHIIKKFKKK